MPRETSIAAPVSFIRWLAAGPARAHFAPRGVHAQKDLMQPLNDRHILAFFVNLVQRPISDRHVFHAGPIENRTGVVERTVLEDAYEIDDRLATYALGQHLFQRRATLGARITRPGSGPFNLLIDPLVVIFWHHAIPQRLGEAEDCKLRNPLGQLRVRP